MTAQKPTRAEDARAIIAACKALDRYGFTTAARLAAEAATDIAAGNVGLATKAAAK